MPTINLTGTNTTQSIASSSVTPIIFNDPVLGVLNYSALKATRVGNDLVFTFYANGNVMQGTGTVLEEYTMTGQYNLPSTYHYGMQFFGGVEMIMQSPSNLSSNPYGSKFELILYPTSINPNGSNVFQCYWNNDFVVGTSGKDYIYGNQGNDYICGNGGADLLDGGDGSDKILGEIGSADTLFGGSGNDCLQEGVYLAGELGDDVIADSEGNTTIVGGVGNDTITVSNTSNGYIKAGDGNDFIELSDDASYIVYGGSGNDSFISSSNSNCDLAGEGGNDTFSIIYGTANGGNGNDYFSSPAGLATLIGGSGNDTFEFDIFFNGVITESAAISGGIDEIRLDATGFFNAYWSMPTGVENFIGTSSGTRYQVIGQNLNNIIITNDQNDWLDGGTGSDTLIGGNGNDLYFVNVVTDVIDESNSTGQDHVNIMLASAGTYTLSANVENASINITTANVNITGNSSDNYLTGNQASNTLIGGAGSDTLAGGHGSDVLTGGIGADYFLFNAVNGWVLIDTITDFTTGLDKITLSKPTFGLSLAPGTVTNLAGLGPNFAYNSTTGALTFDPDGAGALPPATYALLTNMPASLGYDFLIV